MATSVSITVVCGHQQLKIGGSAYLKEPPNSRIKTTTTLTETIQEFMLANPGVQFSIIPSDPNVQVPPLTWILTPRKGPAYPVTPVKGNVKHLETNIQAAQREFAEETGTLLADRFFFQDPVDPSKFCVNIATAAKSLLDANYEALKPATETYSWTWEQYNGPACTGPVVQAIDVAQTPVTQAVLDVKKRLFPVDQEIVDDYVARVGPLNPTMTADQLKHIATNTFRLSTVAYPRPLAGETLTNYVARAPNSAARALYRNHGRRLGLMGGRTIRRKKSKQPKRKGTSKK